MKIATHKNNMALAGIYSKNGGGGNRTRVRRKLKKAIYLCSLFSFLFIRIYAAGGLKPGPAREFSSAAGPEHPATQPFWSTPDPTPKGMRRSNGLRYFIRQPVQRDRSHLMVSREINELTGCSTGQLFLLVLVETDRPQRLPSWLRLHRSSDRRGSRGETGTEAGSCPPTV